jgi:hypothetical protein
MEFIPQKLGADTLNVVFVTKVSSIAFHSDDLFRLSAFFVWDMSGGIRICNCKPFPEWKQSVVRNVVKESINVGMSSKDDCKEDSLDYLSREGVNMSTGGPEVASSLELGTG